MSGFAAQWAPLAAAALAMLAVGASVWALIPSRPAAKEVRRARIEAFATPIGEGGDGDAAQREAADQQAIQTAKSIRKRSRSARADAVRTALRQAGLDWSLRLLVLIALTIAAVVGVGLRFGGAEIATAAIIGAIVSPGLLLLVLKTLRSKRKVKMEKEFPGAIDIIVRGVKSGLPLNDCLDVVSREVSGPLQQEFSRLVEQQRHGLSAGDAVRRFAERVPLTEANFFAIVIGLQTKTGGRLAESLENLTGVLRARTQLRAKIKSMSSEAKASGGIIAAMPPVVAGLVWATSPDYIGILFTETAGNLVLVGSAVWMLIGVGVMKKMISFDH